MTTLYLEVPIKDIKKSRIKSMLSVRRQVVAEVDAPRSTTVTTEIIAFNIEESCKVYVVINDGEVYPTYKVQSSIMTEYSNYNAEDVDGILTTKLPL
uniref:Uncharacterized protein n=1 Tax=Magallana gigas TaxID=29159 RepID=A0A8W8NTY4_MAGGI